MSYSYEEMKALEAEQKKWTKKANDYQTLAQAANEAKAEVDRGVQNLKSALQRLSLSVWSGPDATACRSAIGESRAEMEKQSSRLQQAAATMTKKEQEARARANAIGRKLTTEVYTDLSMGAKVKVTADTIAGKY